MVTIKINTIDYQFDDKHQTGAALIEKAGYDPAHYALFKIKNGKSHPAAAEIQLSLKEGEEFSVLPKDLNFGGL